MNILFLDYDGVVNNIIWGHNGERANYGTPKDNKVNDYQACQWISEFCEKYDYKIVVTSSWTRLTDTWKECLINGGLREGIEILGCVNKSLGRSKAVAEYIQEHPEVENYIIVDDEIVLPTTHLIQCKGNRGFGYDEFAQATELHTRLLEKQPFTTVLGCDSFADGVVLHLKSGEQLSVKYEDIVEHFYIGDYFKHPIDGEG